MIDGSLDGSGEILRAQREIRGFSPEVGSTINDRVRTVQFGANNVRRAVSDIDKRVAEAIKVKREIDDRRQYDAELIANMPGVVAPVEHQDNSPVDPVTFVESAQALVAKALENK